jgi:hypothetical protein
VKLGRYRPRYPRNRQPAPAAFWRKLRQGWSHPKLTNRFAGKTPAGPIN